jgi:aconitate hydratase
MMRGTFANVRIKNLMIPSGPDGSREEGGVTLYRDGRGGPEKMFIYDAAMRYMAQGRPTVIFAGEEYGTGSSRDWAAKGTLLQGIRAVLAESFERIHRSNLVGMGVLPLQFVEGEGAENHSLTGKEVLSVRGLAGELKPRQKVTVDVTRPDGKKGAFEAVVRLDTPVEINYYRNGGILHTVLRKLLKS